MKIFFSTMKAIFPEGKHFITIMSVRDDLSERKKTPYFECWFENDLFRMPKRFYVTGPRQRYLAKLFQAAGIYREHVDTQELIGKSLCITVEIKENFSEETGFVQRRREIVWFDSAKHDQHARAA